MDSEIAVHKIVSPRWLMAIALIASTTLLLTLLYLGLQKWPNGDEGIYLSGGYHLAAGNIAHRDHWWPQGIGLSVIVASIGTMIEFDLLLMRLVTLTALLAAFILAVILIKRFSENKTLYMSFYVITTIGIASQSSLLYYGSSLGTKEGILCLLLMLCVASYLYLNEKDNLARASFFAITASLLVLFKPNLSVGLLFFLVHYLIVGGNRRNAMTAGLIALCLIFGTYFILFRDFASFELMWRDISLTSRDIHLRGYDLYDALALFVSAAKIIGLNFLFMLFFLPALRGHQARFPGTIILGFWLTNMVTTTIIHYPSLFPVYFYQFNLVLLLGLLFYIKRHTVKLPAYVTVILTATPFLSLAMTIMPLVQPLVPHKYNFAQSTSYFYSHKLTNALNLLPTDDQGYLYIGRRQFITLPSTQRQSIYSVGGTVNADLLKPERALANEMRVIAASNIEDVIKRHNIIVFQNYLLKSPHFTDTPFMDLFASHGFSNIICDLNHCLYARQSIASEQN